MENLNVGRGPGQESGKLGVTPALPLPLSVTLDQSLDFHESPFLPAWMPQLPVGEARGLEMTQDKPVEVSKGLC